MHASAVIEHLGLLPHPEGGYYRETFRAPLRVEVAGDRIRAASTSIYFLLPHATFSAWHRVRSDEVWHHYDGVPLELALLDAEGRPSFVRLGRNWSEGEVPQHVVCADVWQAARPLSSRDGEYALCGCTVAPGFDFADFEMPSRRNLVERFPHRVPEIERFTRDQ